MAATCATCLKPIVEREKFVLAGTEVFHARCALATGTTQSVKAKLDQTIVELTRETAMLRVQLAASRRDAEKAVEISGRIANERDKADAAERSWRRRLDDARAERDRFAYERDKALEDLAVIRQRLGSAPLVTQPPTSVPATPVAAATPEPAKDERDDTEIRFSLLELDKS